MLSIAVLLVVASGLIHSVWNLFTKCSLNKVVFLWYCQWAAILFFLPWTWNEMLSVRTFPIQGFLLMLGSMVLHGLYVLLLAKTYSIGNLSQAYPIMRGTSPLLVPVIGVLILGENLKLLGWFGVLSIVVGIFLASGIRSGFLKSCDKSVLLALSVGFIITFYTLMDKVALKYVPAITLNEATNVGNLIALSWAAFRSGSIRQEWRINWKTIILGGIMAPGGYILFLKALQIMPAAQIAPMREIGTVFGTFLGIFVLHELQGKNRLIASVLITVGIILLSR